MGDKNEIVNSLSSIIKMHYPYDFKQLLKEATLENNQYKAFSTHWENDTGVERTIKTMKNSNWDILQGISVDVGRSSSVIFSIGDESFQYLKYSSYDGTKISRGIAKTITGGLLFGSIGAVAGALSENSNTVKMNTI